MADIEQIPAEETPKQKMQRIIEEVELSIPSLDAIKIDSVLSKQTMDTEVDLSEDEEFDVEFEQSNINYRERQEDWRYLLLHRDGGCAASGSRLFCVANHIFPHRFLKEDPTLTSSLFSVNNGVMLCPTLTAAFDAGLACIEPETRRMVISDVVLLDFPDLRQYHGLDMSHVDIDVKWLVRSWLYFSVILSRHGDPKTCNEYKEEVLRIDPKVFHEVEDLRKIRIHTNRNKMVGPCVLPSEKEVRLAKERVDKFNAQDIPPRKRPGLTYPQIIAMLRWYRINGFTSNTDICEQLSKRLVAPTSQVLRWMYRERRTRRERLCKTVEIIGLSIDGRREVETRQKLRQVYHVFTDNEKKVLYDAFFKIGESIPDYDTLDRLAQQLSLSRLQVLKFYYYQRSKTPLPQSDEISQKLQSEILDNEHHPYPRFEEHKIQSSCSIHGCESGIGRRHSKSLSVQYRFKKGFLEHGWNGICEQHYYQDHHQNKSFLKDRELVVWIDESNTQLQPEKVCSKGPTMKEVVPPQHVAPPPKPRVVPQHVAPPPKPRVPPAPNVLKTQLEYGFECFQGSELSLIQIVEGFNTKDKQAQSISTLVPRHVIKLDRSLLLPILNPRDLVVRVYVVGFNHNTQRVLEKRFTEVSSPTTNCWLATFDMNIQRRTGQILRFQLSHTMMGAICFIDSCDSETVTLPKRQEKGENPQKTNKRSNEHIRDRDESEPKKKKQKSAEGPTAVATHVPSFKMYNMTNGLYLTGSKRTNS